MKNLEIILIDENKVYEFIRENIIKCRTPLKDFKPSRFHHNTSYKNASTIVQHGILNYKDVSILRGEEVTKEKLAKFNQEDHVNGISSVSLSDSTITEDDLYGDYEELYDHKTSHDVDFCISPEIQEDHFVHRSSLNYANEYLVDGMIPPAYFDAIDVRIIEELEKQGIYREKISTKEQLIEYYNSIIEIAKTLVESKKNIPFREMSELSGYEKSCLDPEKLSQLPKISLKK